MERGAGTAATGRREEPPGSRVPAKEGIVAVTEQRDETEEGRGEKVQRGVGEELEATDKQAIADAFPKTRGRARP